MPLVSVIIPTYNRADFLQTALATLQAQEFTDYEIIVIDDGSTDATPEKVAEFAEQLAPGVVHYIRQENAGQGVARNRGISQARGEYCVFLDSDDLFFPWSLSIVAEAIETHGRPSVVLGRDVPFRTIGGFNAIPRQPARFSVWRDIYDYATHQKLGPCGILVAKTQALRDVGGFIARRMVGEDSELMFRLGIAPGLVKIEEPGLYGYRQHSDNFTGDAQPWYDGTIEVLRRYRQGIFPGGRARAGEARQCAAELVSGFSRVCLYRGRPGLCVDLYWRSLFLQIRARQIEHLFKTPLLLILHVLGRWPSPAMKAYMESLAP